MTATPHLPDEMQTLLLRAALADTETALAAWREWQVRAQWETETAPLDSASQRLLPLVYTSLARVDPPLSDLSRLKALHRRTWYDNNRRLHLAKPAIRALLHAGHRVMVVKGASLLARYYGDRGARPMGDVDVLVAESEAPAALDELERLGWVSGEPGQAAQALIARHHAVNLIHPSGGRVDLHRRLLADSRPDADGPLWERAEPVALDDLPLLAPCAADELLLACIHGWQWQPVPSIRWIHDAVAVARRMQAEDWLRLEHEARRRQVSFRLAHALRVIRDRFDAPVPADVLTRIEGGPFAWFEAAEARSHTRPPGLVPGLARAYFAHGRELGPPDGPGWWLGCARRFWFVRNPPSGARLAPWLLQWAARRIRSSTTMRRQTRASRDRAWPDGPDSSPRAQAD